MGTTASHYLSMHCAARQAVLRAALMWLSQRQLSKRLSHRSMLVKVLLQASTSLIKLSCSGRPLQGEESSVRGLVRLLQWGAGVQMSLAGQCDHPCHNSTRAQHSPSPLQGLVQPPPLGVGGFGLRAPASHSSFLCCLCRPRVNDKTLFPLVQYHPQKQLILTAALSVGTCQRLAAAEHCLWGQTKLGASSHLCWQWWDRGRGAGQGDELTVPFLGW